MTHTDLSQSSSLDDWLNYLESIHPANIAMGLERVRDAAEKIGLLTGQSKILLIAGTNGKGTTARCLESMLLAQGFSVGTYASPHLIHYNERVRVNGKELEDQIHVDAFCRLEQGRGDIPLTYFEYGTLGALAIFQRFDVDFVLLEVGLGGRYDATNIVAPFASVITTIDLDHKEYLGDTRELVGYDKAGIFRPNTPAIVGDLAIPHTVTDYGTEINADMVLSGRDFSFVEDANGFNWRFAEFDYRFEKPSIPCQNVATALTTLATLGLLPAYDVIAERLKNLQVPGRWQRLSQTPLVYTDVAHNPESARYLAKRLSEYKEKGVRVEALIGMLADKDKVGALSAVNEVVDAWHIASLDVFRGESAEQLGEDAAFVTGKTWPQYPSVTTALDKILPNLGGETLLIVFGSFYTVAEAINYWQSERGEQ